MMRRRVSREVGIRAEDERELGGGEFVERGVWVLIEPPLRRVGWEEDIMIEKWCSVVRLGRMMILGKLQISTICRP